MESNYKKKKLWICIDDILSVSEKKKLAKFIASFKHSCFSFTIGYKQTFLCSLEMVVFMCAEFNSWNLLFVFIFCAVFQNSSKFDVIEESIFDGRFTVHFIDIFIGKTVAHRGQQFP